MQLEGNSLTLHAHVGRTQVAALRVLAGLLEASAEGMDAFRVRDGFNVLYHALAQGDDALQQVPQSPYKLTFFFSGSCKSVTLTILSTYCFRRLSEVSHQNGCE